MCVSVPSVLSNLSSIPLVYFDLLLSLLWLMGVRKRSFLYVLVSVLTMIATVPVFVLTTGNQNLVMFAKRSDDPLLSFSQFSTHNLVGENHHK